ncbi:DnaJ-domain-containing protein [Mytilinidion resinicola]|uniref:DnaJ-domain-containing protein n=1 Tax=Mytilinidion resinicola TaxID=574789 RepID=A0A6A6YC49_9PEZI|nr:DnaJ-domain-containing protein [Mytilinidion resinicola]KAF2806391.1 DnaJ-domain-containing protein [Mytilinidion resinicola]
MSSEDLKDHAKTADVDFYELLGVAYETSESDIKRAYRKTSLQYHPDKNPGKLDVIEKFHLLAIARDVLLDPEAKALYDRLRQQKRQRELEHQLLDGKRRQMKEDLEARENGFKRKRNDDFDAEEKLAREIRRLAEDGKRRRMQREEMLSRKKQEGEEPEESSIVESDTAPPPKSPSEVPDENRTVKVCWLREGAGVAIDKTKLAEIFSKFGKTDSVWVRKDKKVRRSDATKHKSVMATGFIVFSSIVAAHAAVEDAKEKNPFLDSVSWWKKPDIPGIQSPPAPKVSAPSTPLSTPKSFRSSFPGVRPGGAGLGTPSFSFSPQSPSLEEVTMMRLKQAEKRRLEDQIRKQEAAADE